MSETDKQIVSPPEATGAKAKRFRVGLVRMVECCLLMGILLVILIVIIPKFCDSLAGVLDELPALTLVVASVSNVVRSRLYAFVPLAGVVMAGLMLLPFVLPARLTVLISTLLLIALASATVAILLGIFLPLMGLYGVGPK